jgi:hypothetical protein
MEGDHADGCLNIIAQLGNIHGLHNSPVMGMWNMQSWKATVRKLRDPLDNRGKHIGASIARIMHSLSSRRDKRDR